MLRVVEYSAILDLCRSQWEAQRAWNVATMPMTMPRLTSLDLGGTLRASAAAAL
jgi:hypothetical protein